jgi:hypothetical protein
LNNWLEFSQHYGVSSWINGLQRHLQQNFQQILYIQKDLVHFNIGILTKANQNYIYFVFFFKMLWITPNLPKWFFELKYLVISASNHPLHYTFATFHFSGIGSTILSVQWYRAIRPIQTHLFQYQKQYLKIILVRYCNRQPFANFSVSLLSTLNKGLLSWVIYN